MRLPRVRPPFATLAGLLRAVLIGSTACTGLGIAGVAIAIAQTAPPPPGMADVRDSPLPTNAPPASPALTTATPIPGVGMPPTGKRQASTPIQRDKPAYYQADQAEDDRDSGIITLTGHVEFWQNERLLLADKVTYDRNTDVAAATGNVVLLEPDGQTVFSDYAELTGGMKDGVMSGMRALLGEGGRLVANGGRRTSGSINELTRAVYSTCDLCAEDPTHPPLWQILAREAIQDKDNKRIEYRDAVVEFGGVPVMWLPYLTHPDPSEKRASGILPPNFGSTKSLGVFAAVPYFWVIDDQSDATITPYIASKDGPALELQYRRRFNDGTLTVNGSIANAEESVGSHLFAKGQFAIDDTWRWGFDINRASSANYVRDFHIQGWSDILTSQLYLEGFGQGSYARIDARNYQGLSSTIQTAKLPTVAPRAEYSLLGPQDALGGRTTVDMDAFNVIRDQGTLSRRLHASAQWDRPWIGDLGETWKASLRLDGAFYSANKIDEQPNYSSASDTIASQTLPTVAVELHWPLVRDAGGWGTQIIEPIAQLVVAPRTASYINATIPNEDSLDLDFTDANLFSLNRYSGIDRLEGGARVNLALHGAWYLKNGTILDAQVGEAFRARKDDTFPTGSGLEKTASDIVSHLSITPATWFDVTSRQRFDPGTARLHFADLLATTGTDALRVNSGFIYSNTSPYTLYDVAPTASSVSTTNTPRNELTLGFSTKLDHWKLRGFARRDMHLSKMTALGTGATYEDECFTFDASFYRRYTGINGDHGDTIILFQITLKTVGEFGFHAL